jgi:pilus assembly protein CpaC
MQAALTLAVIATCVTSARVARADNEKLRIPVGQATVVSTDDAVKTVVIAEPKIADATVGSERTVVVNAKSVGLTSLVVYGVGGRFKVYDIDVYTPNADKQVVLHVRVAELNDEAQRELGFDFAGAGVARPGHDGGLTGGLFTTKVASPSIPLLIGPKTDGAFQYADKNFFLQATWRALEEKGDIRVLANPTLVARSGQKASFLSGGEFPVPIASSSGAVNQAVTVTIEWKEFGVKVDFTPTVDADGSIDLKVAPEVSALDFTNPLVLSGFVVPTINSRKTSTTVHLNPGEHLVIGGLKQTESNKVHKKVPILGDIPIVNFFFSTTKTEHSERELMVVVSPEMMAGGLDHLPTLPTDRPEH